MSGGLPSTINPILLAEAGTRLTGAVAVRTMARLSALLLNDSGAAEINLAFAQAVGSGVRKMRGRIQVPAVNVTCQRCLEPMQLALETEVDVVLLREGEPDGNVSPEVDVLSFGPAPVGLAELIEDELLLALPLVPMHAVADCPARRYIGARTGDETAEHPLAGLARPKRD